MAESTIPVDLRNPGQVFACLGLLEAADVLLGHAVGVFAWGTAAEGHVPRGGLRRGAAGRSRAAIPG